MTNKEIPVGSNIGGGFCIERLSHGKFYRDYSVHSERNC